MFGSVGSRMGIGARRLSAGTTKHTMVERTLSTLTIGQNVFFNPQWDTIGFDEVGAFTLSANTIMTVPAGYTKARHTIVSLIQGSGLSNSGFGGIWLYKNSILMEFRFESTSNNKALVLYSKWYENLVHGDQFITGSQFQIGGGNLFWGISGANPRYASWGVEWKR